MWFNDDDDEGFGFGGAPQQQASTPGMLQGGGLTSLDPGMKMILLSQMMQGGNPMQSLTAISQMQGMQQRNQYQQAMLALKKKQAERDEAYASGMGQVFEGGQGQQPPGPGADTSNLPDPGAGEWGPQSPPMEAGQPGMQQPGAQNSALVGQIDRWRRASQFAARTGRDEAAKRYADIANDMEQRLQGSQGTWSLPQKGLGTDGKPVLYQINTTTGEKRLVQDIAPTRNLTAPTASANGLVSMDQDTGEMHNTGVGVHEPTPAEIQQYQMAVTQGFKGSILDYQKAKAAAGASRVTLSPEIRVGNTLGENVAQKVADRVMNEVGQGDSALNTLDQVNTIRQNVDKAITGPANEPRTVLARLQQMVGLGSKATAEQLAATAKTAQALAATELTAAEAMKGQGQITEAERAIIARTAAGKLNNSPEEIRAATEALEKVARNRIRQAQRNAKAIKSIPDFKPLYPFIDGKLANVPDGGPEITPLKGRTSGGPVGGKTIARTGKTKDGRTVVEYTDGTREIR